MNIAFIMQSRPKWFYNKFYNSIIKNKRFQHFIWKKSYCVERAIIYAAKVLSASGHKRLYTGFQKFDAFLSNFIISLFLSC